MRKVVKKTGMQHLIDALPVTKREKKQVSAAFTFIAALADLANQGKSTRKRNDDNIIDIDYEEVK